MSVSRTLRQPAPSCTDYDTRHSLASVGCTREWRSDVTSQNCRDPNKPLVRLYAVPADAFQRDDYEEEPLQDADDADEPATPVAVDDD